MPPDLADSLMRFALSRHRDTASAFEGDSEPNLPIDPSFESRAAIRALDAPDERETKDFMSVRDAGLSSLTIVYDS